MSDLDAKLASQTIIPRGEGEADHGDPVYLWKDRAGTGTPSTWPAIHTLGDLQQALARQGYVDFDNED